MQKGFFGLTLLLAGAFSAPVYADQAIINLVDQVQLAAAPIAEAGTNSLGDLKPEAGVWQISKLKQDLRDSLETLLVETKNRYGLIDPAHFMALTVFLHEIELLAADVYAYRIPMNMNDPYSVIENKVNWMRGGSAQTRNARSAAQKIQDKVKVLKPNLL